jgi:cysteinyl-tRNA synthetase
MQHPLKVLNTLSRQKEEFKPINAPFVGMYVCGPTVYSDVHLGNVRTFISFDVIYRYLKYLGYKVRYVRNITDVGHLENDADEGTDKIAKKAKIENLEPMEIVQRYSNGFHDVMQMFNTLPPSIEPTATGHIIEQIETIQRLLDNGYAYEKNGSVYFDVLKYNEAHQYGILSGRVLEDLYAFTRELDGQSEKENSYDFALWKKASPDHIMRWKSPWSDGYPGWHLECTVMSTKYLGEQFDIHGGGMDLKFPHHECEIAQSVGSHGKSPVKYWLHTNMLTVNGQKMSKSLGNSFLPHELIAGSHELLDKPYSPMAVRFFMLQSHYASTLDFSNQALQAAQKGYMKLMNGLRILEKLEFIADSSVAINEKLVKEIETMCDNCDRAMSDDFNTAQTIAQLFNILKKINGFHTGNLAVAEIGQSTFDLMKRTYQVFIKDILGLKEEHNIKSENLINAILDVYKTAKEAKDYARIDELRAQLKSQGVVIKDMKNGVDWALEE